MHDVEIMGISAESIVLTSNCYFCNIGKEIAYSCCDVPVDAVPDRVVNSFGYVNITPAEVVTVVKAMPCKHSAGCDKVSPFILKNFIDILCAPLAKIFNHAFLTSSYPDLLKIARVVPIHKKGDCCLPENYHPISVLSAINIVLEKRIAKSLLNFLDREFVLANSQRGSQSNRSTSTAVPFLSDMVNYYLNNNMIV